MKVSAFGVRFGVCAPCRTPRPAIVDIQDVTRSAHPAAAAAHAFPSHAPADQRTAQAHPPASTLPQASTANPALASAHGAMAADAAPPATLPHTLVARQEAHEATLARSDA